MQKSRCFEYSQSYLDYGFKELTIAPGPFGQWMLEKEALHIWPWGKFMMIALPNLDGSFTCTLFFPFTGRDSFSSIKTEEALMDLFRKEFPDAVPLMPELVE